MTAGRTKTRTDVVLEALGLKVERERGGRSWILCPFHESQSVQAFFVRRSGARAGQFHCFVCRAGGRLADLAARVKGLDEEAARDFVRTAGKKFEPPRKTVRVVARPAILSRERFSMPLGFEREPLADWPEAAREYLEGRGLGEEEVETFRIGYAVDGPLAGRVVIPFLDERARPGTYSARTVCDDVPKYKTPFENEGAILDTVFGSHLWPHPADRLSRIVAVSEGAIDAMSVRRALASRPELADVSIAALNGSNVEPGHVLALSSFGGVICATDFDKAGQAAAKVLRAGVIRHAAFHRVLFDEDANTCWLDAKHRALFVDGLAVAAAQLRIEMARRGRVPSRVGAL